MSRKSAVVVLLGSFIAGLAPAASAASPAAASLASANPATAGLAAVAVVCTSKLHPAVAAAMARDIQAARRGRSSTVAVWFDDPGAGITCSLRGSSHFDSASIVKVTILAAVLRKALDQHRYLTSTEAAQLRAMITRSDNKATSALWAKLGHSYLQHFLNLAGMRQTVLGPGGYWGLTQVTAHDETLLPRLLLTARTVLTGNSLAARDRGSHAGSRGRYGGRMLNVQLVTVLEQPGVGEPDRLPGVDTQLENQPVRQVDEIFVGHGQPTQDRRLAVIASVRIGTG